MLALPETGMIEEKNKRCLPAMRSLPDVVYLAHSYKYVLQFVYNNIRHCGLLDLDYAGAFDGGVNNATDILL